MKKIILIIITAALIGCSGVSYKVRYMEAITLLERSQKLAEESILIVDSLQTEVDSCRIELRNIKETLKDSTGGLTYLRKPPEKI